MSESKRKVFTGVQKAKLAIEAIKAAKTTNEIVQEHGVHPNQVSQWKKELNWLKKSLWTTFANLRAG